MQKIYSRINWENFPSEKTALNESNLNKMDLAIYNLDDRVVAMDASKVDLTRANELVEEILWDESNGTLTVVKMNGSRAVIDTKLEKLAVNFTYNPQTQQLVIALDDGTVQNVDLSALITQYEFLDSDTIAFEIAGGKVKAIVKNGSITEDKLQPNFLADVKTEVAKAQASQESAAESASAASGSATLAESYAHGGTGAREGEDSDNARYYMEQAKAVSAVDIATTEKAGIVKPDGTTITVDEDGTLHGQSKVDEMTGATAEKDGTSGTVPAPTAGQEAHILNGDGTWKSPLDNAIIAAKIQELNKAIEDATALRASLEAYGMVKLCDSSAVTDSTGLALPATEKNASIEGTLAAQIASLNTDWELIGSATATNSVTIDSGLYTEFYVSLQVYGVRVALLLISSDLNDNSINYNNGWYRIDSSGKIQISVSKNSIAVAECYVNNSDCTSLTSIKVYGRK